MKTLTVLFGTSAVLLLLIGMRLQSPSQIDHRASVPSLHREFPAQQPVRKVTSGESPVTTTSPADNPYLSVMRPQTFEEALAASPGIDTNAFANKVKVRDRENRRKNVITVETNAVMFDRYFPKVDSLRGKRKDAALSNFLGPIPNHE